MGIPFGLTNVNMRGLDLCGVDTDTGVAFGVTSLDGWEGAPAATTRIEQRSLRSGGIVSTAYSAGRHVTVKGWLHTYDPSKMLAAKDKLKQAFGRTDGLLTVYELGVPRWGMFRREDEPVINRKTRWYAEWSMQVVSADWRLFGPTLTKSTSLPSTSGGLALPTTVPFLIGATTVTGQVTLTNPGDEVGPVTLRIDGPCHGPVITHRGSGLSLQFSSSLVLGSGEWLLIDMERRQALANGQVSRSGYITSRGWSGFEPGDNTWAFTAAQYDAGATLTVTATPSWE
ncbi:hypothetical protein ACFJGV_15180 [Cnuibacter sp. UC19_7]|uniref:hypothetical protein n=1 Tax=Cnuibacter sp. UC19_7 TaxID=3350166 RepID=UPI00366E031A